MTSFQRSECRSVTQVFRFQISQGLADKCCGDSVEYSEQYMCVKIVLFPAGFILFCLPQLSLRSDEERGGYE
jgi:hypothetical protein